MKQNSELMDSVNLNEFTNRLKKQDNRYARLYKRERIIMLFLLSLYLLIMLVDFDDKTPIVDIIGSICKLFGLLIFVLLIMNFYKDFKFVDYSQSTLVMLKKAAYRYQPFKLKALWVLFGAFLLAVGDYLVSSSVRMFPLYLGVIVLCVIIGLIIWWIRYKPLFDEAMKLICEIEG
ncbi:MAG: hypothetical protein PHD00_01005 [Bacteroidales bacterium]|nr:hypothetical protein [Bacteroidales bacterium]MDD4672558.1 hypothetical protein [Bacteroidales bacterium]MDY0348136.1 hypothetical protein [Tenuifilaceae bacterium]